MNEACLSVKRRSRVLRVVRALLVTVVVLYVLIATAVWWAQTRVLYHPRKTLDVTPAISV